MGRLCPVKGLISAVPLSGLAIQDIRVACACHERLADGQIGCELRRFARNNDLDAAGATKQPDGQITKILSSPFRKNIPLSPSGKSMI